MYWSLGTIGAKGRGDRLLEGVSLQLVGESSPYVHGTIRVNVMNNKQCTVITKWLEESILNSLTVQIY